MKLVAEWKHAWRLWSVRFSFMGLLTQILALADWPMLLSTFNMMPAALRELLPRELLAGLSAVFFLAAMASRIVAQPKVTKNVRAQDPQP